MASTSMSIALPTVLPSQLDSPLDSSSVMSSMTGSPHRRKHSRNPKLPPLPAFSFNPGVSSEESPELERAPSPTHPILEEMAARQESQRSFRPTPLPAFSFNPAAAVEPDISRTPSPTHPILEEMAQIRSRRSSRPANLTDFNLIPRSNELQPSPSPTKSSFGEVNPALRHAGHRRRGSEFVGGGSDGSHLTTPTMVSTSPNKTDNMRSPGPPISGPGPVRHRHRRSEAVSISGIDASELIKANAVAKHKASSAPSTPSETIQSPFAAENSPRINQPVCGPSNSSRPTSPRVRRESAPGVRPRVGFSDTVDVIPRPLSLISSETEGSSSTIRGTHSLTGSINSFAAASPPPQSAPTFVLNHEDGSPRRRPNTADAASPSPSSFPKNRVSPGENAVARRPVSASGSPSMSTGSASPSTKKKHFWFSPSNDSSPKASLSFEKTDPIPALPSFTPASPSPLVRPKTSPERSASIKKRKVRTWTGHLFSRKGRHQSAKTKGRRTPTPPLLTRQPSDQTNEIFDADHTIILRNSPSPDQEAKIFEKPQMTCVAKPTTSPAYRFEPDERVTSPLLDLDAALGPFGSEEKLANEENALRGASSRISRLHSSERRTPMDAFGSFHRRAESAPQMAPINRSVFGVHRLGSSASIADDVFDEEEEDDFLANEKVPGRLTTTTPDTALSAGIAEGDSAPSLQSQQEPAQRLSLNSEQVLANNGLGIANTHNVVDRIAIVDSEEDLDSRPARSSNSTITAPVLSEADLPKRPASSPMEFLYGAPQTSYASSTEGRTAPSSAISSPDADNISFDNPPRLSRYAGEQSFDIALRASNDDLPSLTDSVSTGVMPRFSSSAGTRSSTEQRAVSFSGPAQVKAGQAWKRASLAGLNRLIPGSANGSKLRFEETAAPAETEKASKKSNRMSRLIHFWRSKEKGEK